MSAKPEALFLSHRIPYPPDKGDKIRSWRWLDHLTKRYAVHLACFVDDRADMAHRAFLSARCASVTPLPLSPMRARLRSLDGLRNGTPLTFAYFRDARMARALAALRARPLAAEFVFSSSMAPYVEERVPGRARIVDFCDADSEKFRDYARAASGPMQRIFAREGATLAAAEKRIARWADLSFAVTPDEAARLSAIAGGADIHWWSNGVDTEEFDPAAASHEVADPVDVVFIGAMDYRANIDAMRRFVANVWPRVRRDVPGATLAIVGARPAASIRALHGRDGVLVTGRVASVRPWLGAAKIAIAPMTVARGLQNKVLEAMAMARPVIASSAAAAGIAARAGEELLVADVPEDVARAVRDLLNDAPRRAMIGAAARARMVQDYQWPRQLSRFDAALSSLASAQTSLAAVSLSSADGSRDVMRAGAAVRSTRRSKTSGRE